MKHLILILTIILLKGGVEYNITTEQLKLELNKPQVIQPPSFEQVFNEQTIKGAKRKEAEG